MHKKNKIANMIMVVAILLIAISGVLFVGNVKGWFSKTETTDTAVVSKCDGVASIQRGGIAYSVNLDTVLQDEDKLSTRSGLGITIKAGSNEIIMDENTEATIDNASNSDFSMNLSKGQIFVVAEKENPCTITFNDDKLAINDTVLSISVNNGGTDINVYSGEAILSSNDSKTIKAGEKVSIVDNKVLDTELKADALDTFNLENARNIGKDKTLCITSEDIDKVTEKREEEIKLVAEEKNKNDNKIVEENKSDKKNETPPSQGSENATNSNSSQNSNGGSSGSQETPSKNESTTQKPMTCTIQIRCDTILNNMGDLKPGKDKYVPSNGVILATTTVEFSEGETVFDVLKRTCEYKKIQLEYSWTPGYNSHYIEGINNLYQFDCGSQSGWMYKVNGWFPNYGVSGYTLKDGDNIVFAYTCKGLGADVGGGM